MSLKGKSFKGKRKGGNARGEERHATSGGGGGRVGGGARAHTQATPPLFREM